ILPRFFTPGREYEEFRRLRDEHFCSMERAGLISFTDGSCTDFRYTSFGAPKPSQSFSSLDLLYIERQLECAEAAVACVPQCDIQVVFAFCQIDLLVEAKPCCGICFQLFLI